MPDEYGTFWKISICLYLNLLPIMITNSKSSPYSLMSLEIKG